MRIRTLLAGLVITGVAAGTATLPAGATTPTPTIADVLLSDRATDDANGFDRNWYDFDIVTQAVLAFPDLTAAAQDPAESLTVFAPNDRAFQVLAYELTGRWLWSENGIFDAIKTNPALKTVLTYHIVPDKISSTRALGADGAVLPTLQGGTIKVDVVSRYFKLITLIDADRNDLNPWIVRTKFDVGGQLANGYIHGISLVLRPGDLP